jgi:hypothetical protein
MDSHETIGRGISAESIEWFPICGPLNPTIIDLYPHVPSSEPT